MSHNNCEHNNLITHVRTSGVIAKDSREDETRSDTTKMRSETEYTAVSTFCSRLTDHRHFGKKHTRSHNPLGFSTGFTATSAADTDLIPK